MRHHRKIQLLADELLNGAGILAPPVPVDVLIRAQGIQIARRRLKDETSGFVYVDPKSNTAVIGLNISHSKTRQRFTLAHELGHFLLHKQAGSFVRVDDRDFFVRFRDEVGGHSLEEREANAFAAAILMPKHFLEHDMQAVGDELSLSSEETFLGEMAAHYGVSRQALSFRLINLGLINVAAFR